VPRLVDVVIIIVTEFGVLAEAARARHNLIRFLAIAVARRGVPLFIGLPSLTVITEERLVLLLLLLGSSWSSPA
jgi:hypothetical protein